MSKIFEKDPVEQFVMMSNDIIDDLMPALAPAAFKIVILIFRKTRGWHKDVDQISFSQIMEGTGIKSSSTIAKHLDTLSEMGIILRTKGDGAWDINSYALNQDFDTLALKNEAGYSEHTLKNKASSALKNKARNGDIALKNEDTKNREEIQKIKLPDGKNAPSPNGQQKPTAPAELTDQQKDELLFFGKHPDTEINGSFDTIQEIKNAGWKIHEPFVEQGIAYYIEAVRSKHPNFGIPNNSGVRNDWYKSVKGHLQDYRPADLESLYKKSIDKHAEDRLKFTRPGSLTNTMTDIALESGQGDIVAWY